MDIELIPHYNQDANRVELLFCNFSYIDGNDLIFKCLKKRFDAELKERIDGMYFITMKIQCNGFEYVLIWHEDFGNYGYCSTQTQAGTERFQADLQEAFSSMNDLFENR